ncbi:MAG: anion permease [bacterium]|nr:MAG: phosphate permease [bacterium]
MTVGLIILAIALAAAFYMAWTIGANDVANAMGTSVGSGALTLVSAILLAAVFEFGGAVVLGASVTETISKGIVETALFDPSGPLGEDGPVLLALGMICALLASAIWLHAATFLGMPVSTTHSIVGAVFGIGIVSFGFRGVDWGTMLQIVMSWLVSPLLGGVLAFGTFITVRRLILESPDPVAATRRYAPYIIGVVVGVMTLSFIYKVLSRRFEAPSVLLSLLIAAGLGAAVGAVAGAFVRATRPARDAGTFTYVERVFALLQIATACFVAFAHGANDVANAVGPLAAVVTLYQTGFTEVVGRVGVPTWTLFLGGGGIVLGLATLGHRVIATIGRQITEITPTRGFSAEFGAATTVLVASSLGLPISTTHTLVGGVIGVGFGHGIAALNLTTVRRIVTSWVATVPVAAVVAAVLFVIARAVVL